MTGTGLRVERRGQVVILEDALRVEREAVRRCSESADQVEGMMAFLEQRRPRFEGR